VETVRHRVQVSAELRDLIPRFLANRRLEVERLRDAIARSDLDGARRIGHGLKGVGGGYGFDEITRLGTEIEQCARAGGTGLEGLARELAEYLENVDITYTTD
jgi:HPt (histidine-containing phosphotransfer) domain-containing protein